MSFCYALNFNTKNSTIEFMAILDSFMKQLAAEIEVDFKQLAPDNQGVYSLPVDEQTTVRIWNLQPTGISFHADVCSCPIKNEDSFYTHALLGNLLGQGTFDMILGLSQDGKQLTLSCDLPYTVSYKEFNEKLEKFLNAIEFWREEANSFEIS